MWSSRVLRARQHVNALSATFGKLEHVLWGDLLEQGVAARGVHLDIGCAAGHVVQTLATRAADRAWVGLEVRALAKDASEDSLRKSGVHGRNACVIRANVQLVGDDLLASMAEFVASPTPLRSVSLIHPDPCFKARQSKRRVLTPQVVRLLSERLVAGGWLYLQTDVPDLMKAMLHSVAHPASGQRMGLATLETRQYFPDGSFRVLEHVGRTGSVDLHMGVRSRREEQVIQECGVVSRALLHQCDAADSAEEWCLPGWKYSWEGSVPSVRLRPAEESLPGGGEVYPWRMPRVIV
jgi:tRNA (guanine-N7-)-methyltransferase